MNVTKKLSPRNDRSIFYREPHAVDNLVTVIINAPICAVARFYHQGRLTNMGQRIDGEIVATTSR
jgi:hypothetical protein